MILLASVFSFLVKKKQKLQKLYQISYKVESAWSNPLVKYQKLKLFFHKLKSFLLFLFVIYLLDFYNEAYFRVFGCYHCCSRCCCSCCYCLFVSFFSTLKYVLVGGRGMAKYFRLLQPVSRPEFEREVV